MRKDYSFREEISWVLKRKEKEIGFCLKSKVFGRISLFGKVSALKCIISCSIFLKGKICFTRQVYGKILHGHNFEHIEHVALSTFTTQLRHKKA